MEKPIETHDWNEKKNARRCELIDKKFQETITDAEHQELAALQQQAIAYQAILAQPRIDAARQLHKELLEEQQQKKEKDKES